MEKTKTKSIISWVQLFIIFGTACLFLFAFTQLAKKPEILTVEGYEFNSGVITSYSGNEKVVNIPSSYSLGPTKNMSGTITFKYEYQAFEFMEEYYARGAEGYYDFYKELISHEYPWVYDYSIDLPTFIEGNDFEVTAIGDGAFRDNYNIEEVKIPSSIKRIGNYTFQYCSNLKKVEIEEGLTFIGDSAFWGCGFEEIKLPNSLEEIYPYAFFSCHQLKKITIPKYMKDLHFGTFNDCSSLETAIILPEDYKIDYTDVYHIFSNCPNLRSIYVPAHKMNYYETTLPWKWYVGKYKAL